MAAVFREQAGVGGMATMVFGLAFVTGRPVVRAGRGARGAGGAHD